VSSPAFSRRGLFGAGVRRALEARLGELEPAAPAAHPRPRQADPPPGLEGDLLPVAELMVELAGVRAGQSVLTVALEDDALTTAAASRGAAVASAEAVRAEWADRSFDAALGSFVATSHPSPRLIADGLTRVVRPGAPIVLASLPDQPWARYETAHRHFFDFPELDVQEHMLRESGTRYALVFCRRP
jgi:hypothetical protein